MGNEGGDEAQGLLPGLTSPTPSGVIRGLSETFGVTPSSGTASFAIPIQTPPGRGGFDLTLSLRYDSGGGNGPFGLGFALAVPSISRRTDRGVPRYDDSDVFILTGAEDLVPVPHENSDGTTSPQGARVVGGVAFIVHQFRPRTEGLFARIERWTRADGDVHWRVTTRDNVNHRYGQTSGARITHPTVGAKVFSWLLEESRDDRGHVVRYVYKAEDGAGVDSATAHEHHRFSEGVFRVTSQRYLKRIQYANRQPVFGEGPAPAADADWCFEIVFDYGEHDAAAPGTRDDEDPARAPWPVRSDAFSSHRATFEVRTYRLCRRVLIYHRFAGLGGASLVRSVELGYDETPFVTTLTRVVQVGHAAGTRAALPPMVLSYQPFVLDDTVRTLAGDGLHGLEGGLESGARFVDLDGDGIPGVLVPAEAGWLYKRNQGGGQLAEAVLERSLPRPAELRGRQQLADVGGDGNLDLVSYDVELPGFFERITDGNERGFDAFRTFQSTPRVDWSDANLRFIDLDGDGFADVLLAHEDAWYCFRSRGKDGFAAPVPWPSPQDEGRATIVFANGEETIHLADMTGDGLTDIVRVRCGEVCYWPSRGDGFGDKVVLSAAARFDARDQFDPRRVRFADVDGSGTGDLLYLGRDGVHLHRNAAGNALAEPIRLDGIPPIDNPSGFDVVDLLGQGTPCAVWSSATPARQPKPIAYVDLTMGKRPFLLSSIENNLGAETRLRYASSTTFALADRDAGRPWITRLPFPVQVVEHVEVLDHISNLRFGTRYAYHHGFFDGVEREFRGFGMVEQWDTESAAAFDGAANGDPATHVPPVLTKTWFHTGAWFGREHISDAYAGLLDAHDTGEYWRAPGLSDAEARDRLLDDTIVPAGLTLDEEREVCRALRGSILRQEVYALDGTPQSQHPYTVTERNFTVRLVEPRGDRAHAVVFTHPREELVAAHERRPEDPRVTHTLTLEVDRVGNVLKALTVAYGRQAADPALPLDEDRRGQQRTLVQLIETEVTHGVVADGVWRAPLPCETTTFELTGYAGSGPNGRFVVHDVVEADPGRPGRLRTRTDRTLNPEEDPTNGRERRRVSAARTLFRKDDLTALLPLGTVEARALPGEQLTLAFTGGLLQQTFRRGNVDLLPNPAALLTSRAAGGGGYRSGHDLKAQGLFPAGDHDDELWAPKGRVFLSPSVADTPAQELAYARAHFFCPRRARDPFDQDRFATYDADDLLPVATRDAAGNRLTAVNDYRVLQPVAITDENGNVRSAAFDALGLLVGTCVTGAGAQGDTLAGFVADLPAATVASQLADPLADPGAVLQGATSRVIHDLFAYFRTKNDPAPSPPVAYTLAREVHHTEVVAGAAPAYQHTFVYCDGFGRAVQTKKRAADGMLVAGGPVVPRFVTSGWVVNNNKGLVVRQFEPFFSASPAFEADVTQGVSPVFFYDPLGRRVATLFPDGSWQKVAFDAWQQVTWDQNDTVLLDLRRDVDVGGAVQSWLATQGPGFQTWYERRIRGGADEQAAARKAQDHADTPTTLVLDPLGRPALTLDHNGFDAAGDPIFLTTRVLLDITGAQREVRDAVIQAGDPRGRLVRRCSFDLTGARIRQDSLDAGSRWMLSDAAARPLRAWDSAGRSFRTDYDALRRPLRTFVDDGTGEVLYERIVYGEQLQNGAARNLRGRVFLQLDQSGALVTTGYDFKGNRRGDVRRFARTFKAAVDWTAVEAAASAVPLDEAALEAALAPRLEAESFTRSVRSDALDRPVQLVAPHSDRAVALVDVIQPSFDRGGRMQSVDVWHGRAQVPASRIDPAVEAPSAAGIDDVSYDAHGRRLRVAWKNGASSTWHYDPESFRLTRLYTRRPGDPQNPPPGAFAGVQHLRWSYDAVGNVLAVADDAQQSVFFRNARVDPSSTYRYDALYRLIEATGREHLGQVGGVAGPSTHDDQPRAGLLHPNDAHALGRYTERYGYDDVGNLAFVQHNGVGPSWTRTFETDEPSRLEPGKRGDRLSRAIVGAAFDVVSVNGNGYDAGGNPQRMAHLSRMTWDARDQLKSSTRQAVNAADVQGQARQGETTWFVYDASGTRVRMVTERAGGARKDERLFLGGFDVYRRYGANALERETLHVLDGERRVASLHRRVSGVEPGVPTVLIRYPLGNHLGSTCVELDATAAVVSYQEYTPYGSTTYRGGASLVEVPSRYRYAGKERDEETGFYFYGARYYAPWLGRFISPDKSGIEGGLSLYAFVSGNPVKLDDPDGARPRLTTWLLTGGNKTEASAEEIARVTSDMRRTDTWFNSAAGYGALVGVVGVFENTFLLGYDYGLAAQGDVRPDNSFIAMGNMFRDKGLSAIPEGIKTQMDAAFSGDAVAFGEFAFGVYMMAEGATNTNIKLPTPRVSFDPALAVAGGGTMGGGFAITLVETQVGALVGSGPPLVLMMENNSDGEGGGTEEPEKPKEAKGAQASGRVASRINLANGPTRFTPLRSTGQPVSAGWKHVLSGHFNRAVSNSRSIFSISPEELRGILQSPKVVRSPVTAIGDGHFVRTVDVARTIGTSSLRKGGGPTSVLTVYTDSAGNLITTFPL